MTKTIFYFLLLIGLSHFCTSCSHQYYAPTGATLLNLHEKGEIKVGGTIGTNAGEGDDKNNYSLIAGYSPAKNIGVMVDFFHIKNKRGQGYGQGFTGEIALGCYHNSKLFPKTKRNGQLQKEKNAPYKINKRGKPVNKSVTFDLYAGYGFGQAFNQYKEGGTFKLSFDKYFLQPGFHIKFNDFIGLSTGARLIHLKYRRGVLKGEIPAFEMKTIRAIQEANPIPVAEWLFKIEGGTPQVKFSLGWAIITNTEVANQFDFVPGTISLGTLINL